jgi:hypothetical protein
MLGIHRLRRKSSNFSAESDNGGSPSARFERRIAETLHEWGFGQDGADHLALNANTPAMHDPQGFETGAMRFLKIFLNDRLNIARRNTVQVEHIGDGNPDRAFVHASLLLA